MMGKSVYAQLWTPKCHFRGAILAPILTNGFVGPTSLHPKLHLDWFSRFSTVHDCNQQTRRQVFHATVVTILCILCYAERCCRLLLLLHRLNGLSRTTWVSLDLNEARDDGILGWQWHQLDHMQTICTSHQTDNHANTSSLSFYGPDALPDAQPSVLQSTERDTTAQ